MSKAWRPTDNSINTRLRYDLVAQHNVRAYKSAYRNAQQSEASTDFIFRVFKWLIMNLLVNPVLYFLEAVGHYLIFKFHQRKIRKSPPLNPSKINDFEKYFKKSGP